jgi:hypothetical protein
VDARVLRRGLPDNGYGELPIVSDHVVAIESLPTIHKDPFDRLLVAQATVEGITLLTIDSLMANIPGPFEWCSRGARKFAERVNRETAEWVGLTGCLSTIAACPLLMDSGRIR